MIIRKTTMQDFEIVCGLYADARDFMRECGNPDQWKDSNPTPEMVRNDIESGASYVCESDSVIAAVFYYKVEVEPTYGIIDGGWLSDEPYGVVHRIARNRGASGAGAGAFCMNWCFGQCRNVRVDTHRDNKPMRKLLERLGYKYCGIIRLANGDERLAFQQMSECNTPVL